MPGPAWRSCAGAKPAPGREAIRKASAQLFDAARRCGDTRGCDTSRFLAAYDALVQQGADLAAGGEGFGAAESGVAGTGDRSGVLGVMPEAGQSITLLKGRDLRELIELNEPVKAAMAEWLTWMRPSLITSWENYQQMRFLMWPRGSERKAGLPEALLFGILAKESNGRVHAVSRARAAGPMQFMPATGARFGLGWRDGFDTRYDPQLAARASVLYFNERFAELNNDLEFAVAAYNGGEGRALRLKQASGGKDFWDPAVTPSCRRKRPGRLRALRAGRRLAVPASRGIRAAVPGGERRRHGDEAGRARVHLPAVDLPGRSPRRLLPAASQPQPALRAAYADPRWHRAPGAGGGAAAHQASCITGPRAELAVSLMAASKPTVPATATRSPYTPPAAGRSYRVKSGDTLSSIARRHRCGDAGALARANGLRSPYVLRAGQQLKLTGCG